MNGLIFALEQTIKILQTSGEAMYAYKTPKETIKMLNTEITKTKNGQKYLNQDVSILYLPTSCIQEIAMVNDWHDEYIEISDITDKFSHYK